MGRAVCDDRWMRLRDMSLDDLVSWSFATALASTGIVLMYAVDVIAGGVLLAIGLTGMHAVRVRFRRRTSMGQSSSRAARSTTLTNSSGD